MRLTFIAPDEDKIASVRLRCLIPAKYMIDNGVTLCEDGDLAVLYKHGFDLKAIEQEFVFDICDDHFSNDAIAPYYHDASKRAVSLTCNSDVMRYVIYRQTGKAATVILEPYEAVEKKPTWGDGLLWFGHRSNLVDLQRVAKTLEGYKCAVVSNSDMFGVTKWDAQVQEECLEASECVIIPTGKNIAKSENRMVTAIRAGKFVVAEPLPSYEKFGAYSWIGNIKEGVDWARGHQRQALAMVSAGQEFIRERYSPETIGRKWLQVLTSAYPKRKVLAA